jgi:hypothetical protein
MKQFREPDNKKVWVMTHRAHTSDRTVPENSVSSVEDAIDSGAEVIECDTHVTSDGVVVVCHDQTINATTDGTGDITKMTYAELQKYNLKDRNGRVTDEKMPTLEEFLKAGRGRIYYNLTNGKSTPLGSSINDGMLATVNMLPTSGSSVSEWTLNEDYLNELLQIYPMVCMIQTDLPDLLIPALQARGLR